MIRRLAVVPTLPETMDIVTHAVRSLLRADGATFVLRDGDLCHYADEDAVGPLWKGRRFPMSACISGWCMTHNKAVAIADIYQDERVPADAYRPTFVRSLAMAPVRRREPFAAVGAYWSHPRRVTPGELDLLQTIADASGLAISVAQLAPVAEARLAAEAAEAAERARAEEFHGLADNIPTLCWMAYADGHIYWYNRRWREYTGMSLEQLEGWSWESVHDPAVLPDVTERWGKSLATGEPFEMTFPLRRHDGVYRPFLTRIVPIRGADGRISRWFGANTDIADQQQQQEHLKLLVNELNHRVKNTLATVQSLAAQTLRGAADPQDAFARLEGRLLSLSAAHNILTERHWEGASLADVVRRTLGPFVMDKPERLHLQGPDIWLRPQAAVALSLAFHELATNATKYGALSVDDGEVAAAWARDRASGELEIIWRERRGPAVAPPRRKGFGSRLLERSLPRELGAPAALAFEPGGLVCRIRLAAAQAEDARPTAA